LMDARGAARLLLADVLHTKGVCLYRVGKHVDALAAWQGSMEIRVRWAALAPERRRSINGVGGLAHAPYNMAAAAGDDDDNEDDAAMELKLALTMEHVAQVYRFVPEKRVMALKLMSRVAATRRRHVGPRHLLYGRTLMMQSVVAEEAGRSKLALAVMETAAEVLRDADGGVPAAELRHVEDWIAYLTIANSRQRRRGRK